MPHRTHCIDAACCYRCRLEGWLTWAQETFIRWCRDFHVNGQFWGSSGPLRSTENLFYGICSKMDHSILISDCCSRLQCSQLADVTLHCSHDKSDPWPLQYSLSSKFFYYSFGMMFTGCFDHCLFYCSISLQQLSQCWDTRPGRITVDSQDTISWAIFGLVDGRNWAAISLPALQSGARRPTDSILCYRVFDTLLIPGRQ